MPVGPCIGQLSYSAFNVVDNFKETDLDFVHQKNINNDQTVKSVMVSFNINESQGNDLVHVQIGLQKEDVVVRLVGEHGPLLFLLLQH